MVRPTLMLAAKYQVASSDEFASRFQVP
jgi:hypothetical protein